MGTILTNQYQVLVKYKKYIDASHALLDGSIVTKSKIVKVTDLTEINNMFTQIQDVKILTHPTR